MIGRAEGPLWYQRYPLSLAYVEYPEPPSTSECKQRRWPCGKETDVHVGPGIDQGRPSVSDAPKSLCQYHLTWTRRYLDFWDCLPASVRWRSLSVGGCPSLQLSTQLLTSGGGSGKASLSGLGAPVESPSQEIGPDPFWSFCGSWWFTLGICVLESSKRDWWHLKGLGVVVLSLILGFFFLCRRNWFPRHSTPVTWQ